MKIQRVASKWAKTRALMASASLAPYIPDTRKYEFSTLQEMLGLYRTVYIKPDRGTYGAGVMRAEWRRITVSQSASSPSSDSGHEGFEERDLYLLRYGTSTETHSTVQTLHAAIQGRIRERLYLVQKGIDLLHSGGRPFDLRVLAQKNPEGFWETTGMLARVAAPMKIVTNYHNGGRIRSVRPLLEEQMTGGEARDLRMRLEQLGVSFGRQLEQSFPGIKEIGLDVAIDGRHDFWVLEVNTLPSLVVFKTFRDKSIYRRIRRYAIAYGRPGLGRSAR
ncbi:YheC/YheD family protein [Paenibacillus glufosinatiresistens]|uniref:YheC/YheD family protein n=1 Tax=Paenibacillus glufosinatiresistens TaxID=3070657 RepID=UPI00286E3154|nr:YheC/YheD family protein [Paenibacillus sp. YX.27]